MATRRTPTEERLCALAGGDLRPLELPAELDCEAHRLVQIGALVALDGPLVSWVAQLDAADEEQLDLDQVLGTLVAIAPIVGTSAWCQRRGRSSARQGSRTQPTTVEDRLDRAHLRAVRRGVVSCRARCSSACCSAGP